MSKRNKREIPFIIFDPFTIFLLSFHCQFIICIFGDISQILGPTLNLSTALCMEAENIIHLKAREIVDKRKAQ